MPKTTQEQNKARLLEGFDLLFNQRNYEAAKRYWSPHYIQHSAHIPPGREGLFNLVKGLPPEMKYENGMVLAEADYVMAHGRYTRPDGPRASKDVNYLFSLAEEELRAFVHAVDQLFGTEQARRWALDWIHEMEIMNWPVGEAIPNWRHATIRASARLCSSHSVRLRQGSTKIGSRKEHSMG